MAKVSTYEKEITPAVPAVVETRYVLDLSEKEAKALRVITGGVIGDFSTIRNQTEDVYTALCAGGVEVESPATFYEESMKVIKGL